MRIGIGYDIHKFTPGRPLILGGIEIPYKMGLLAHSDGDVLLHSIGDAILGAYSMGDLGRHFPDTDEKWRGISSAFILEEIMKMTGANVVHMDSVVVCETPKLSTYIKKMRERIAGIMDVSLDAVSVKATTEEGLLLRGEGIAAYSVVLCS
ncbi:MAG: 2-C-methyl-D-erythritol 2,4-cyclodiphosphate synthase [bacterium (Candidatus Stahlbacteria) CG08_land_8_20_14_0_20_40_26]|nr:MAG: 2-C-methyl-D-erythritol 2,4-cyclodiphosphate synthase [bacterium (Candidatus Stahlbacteria) CG23_combo_of_CG06-09_8_20_14_all_40_9]PIS25447.1 MAG: 2-C-methyl-D-erythritol 2,4-cyclodiphosphate synthase [bacterium (Candidatus Stahlbacteria) CG08_land_8_20_14_0_20_40_26]